MSSIVQNRRDFIRNLAITSSVAALAASPWLSVFGDDKKVGKSASDQVRIAIIGTGSRGNELLRNMLPFYQLKNINLVALCDNFQPHLDETNKFCIENKITPNTYLNYREMVEKEQLDGVIIATPLYEHAHMTVYCLQQGLHVFCEKSMARTLADTKRMYDAHLSANRILHIGHQRLFNPVYLEGMQRIHNGELGTIGQIRAYWHRNNNWRRPLPNNQQSLERQINWRLYHEYSAGLLTELMSHQIQGMMVVR